MLNHVIKPLPASQLLVAPGMNHALKVAPPGEVRQMPAYTGPACPLAPALVPAPAGFFNKAAKD